MQKEGCVGYLYSQDLRFESYIARRIIRGSGNKLSRPIVLIATLAVSLGVALMIISLSVLLGFQKEVKDKVVGFTSHIQVVSNQDNYSKESLRINAGEEYVRVLKSMEGVTHVQQFALMPGILETPKTLDGVVIKGISADFRWDFLQERLDRGEVLDLESEDQQPEILLSSYLANRMELDTGDRVTMYMVRSEEEIKPRPFRIKGIYSTGLEDFDKKYVFVDQRHIQKINHWGLQAQILAGDSCVDGMLQVEGLAFGGDGRFDYEWDNPDWRGPGPHFLDPSTSSKVKLIVHDYSETLPDTAHLNVTCGVDMCCPGLVTNLVTSGGSYRYYTGGYDVFLSDIENLEVMDDEIYKSIPFDLQTRNVVDQNPEIFNWLEMLDINVYIIIGLMIFISLVNMTSALLIIILERTNMIGLLKAFGARDKSLLSIFMRYALVVIGTGLVVGNLLGVGLCFLQIEYGIISLNPATYFVDKVPILVHPGYLIFLNAATIIICLIFLIAPGMYVSKISPVRAIRFE